MGQRKTVIPLLLFMLQNLSAFIIPIQTNLIGDRPNCINLYRKHGEFQVLSMKWFRRTASDFETSQKTNSLLQVPFLFRQIKGHANHLRTKKIVSVFASLQPLFMAINGSKEGSTKDTMEEEITLLRQENKLLRENLNVLEQENRRLERQNQNRIVIEQFEGEGKPKFNEFGQMMEPWWDDDEDTNNMQRDLSTNNSTDADTSILLQTTQDSNLSSLDDTICTEWDDDSCPVEPDVSFNDALRDRAYWLVGLLIMQSLSGIILSRNEELLRTHPVIVYFLTMLVGAGGNAGNQASVRVIRGLALGTLNENSQRQFLSREFKMALSLSSILSFAGFVRASLFRTPFAESIAVTAALALIVFSSICLGALLPLFLKKIDVDPAHSSTSIQVIMDILGVILTVVVSNIMLDSRLGHFILSRLPL